MQLLLVERLNRISDMVSLNIENVRDRRGRRSERENRVQGEYNLCVR